jgi:aconitate hydratase
VSRTLAHKLLQSHLVDGELRTGHELAIRIDQTLTQDATGTLVMLELEAMDLERAKTELSVQYVDHNLIQSDHRNPDDHLFLLSACRRWGIRYSRAGNGVSHPVHMQRFGKPGKTLLGSDSHTPAGGALGMLAIGAGGLEVALAIAGQPFRLKLPEIWGIRVSGELPEWVSAKDVILELLRRHGVRGGRGRIIEYYGSGLAALDAWDRHVIANMGTELGAISSLFPADEAVRRFLEAERRGGDFVPLCADDGASYDHHDELDLSALEPMIAKPSSPGNVVPVREVAGEPIYQAYIGSSANPGYRDFALPAMMVAERRVADGVSFDVNPTSREMLEDLLAAGHIGRLVHAGARLHQAGCNGCIGMGQAPATGKNSLRTVPRNFPGRSGTREDRVWLCSPETATASALTGVITDPRTLGIAVPKLVLPEHPTINEHLLDTPLPSDAARRIELLRGPNIAPLPEMDPIDDQLELPVLLVVGDDISTDEIMPAGSRVLPFRSNIARMAEFCFEGIDESYAERALDEPGGHAIVAGDNYGQGSSREHAALVPRHLGLKLVIAKSFARIHRQNLINFGILPLRPARPVDIRQGARLKLSGVHEALRCDRPLAVIVDGSTRIELESELTRREVEGVLAGSLINWMRQRKGATARRSKPSRSKPISP